MLNAQATYNDCNIIIPWGFIFGGRDGGRLGGLIYPTLCPGILSQLQYTMWLSKPQT